ncbi:syntaxin-71-like [Euphorbia lathyris]|uniref:syntaxin-71-like n=1 Tax=Euphorbia lathyris TaxID=212925 RepID=UPI0033138342
MKCNCNTFRNPAEIGTSIWAISRIEVIVKSMKIGGIRRFIIPASQCAFARLYDIVEANLDATIEKSELAAAEKNRATVIAIKAEIRTIKGRLLEEIPKLQRLAFKKVKRLSRE